MSSSAEIGRAALEERLDALSTWIGEIADRVRATELATGDEKTAKELRRALEAVAKHDPRLESRLTNRIDVLTDRLGTLASAVSTTSSELARRDGEIAAVRRELERGSAQIQALGRELALGASTVEIQKLRETVAALSTEHTPRKSDEQVVRLGGKVDYLTERVDTLAKTVAATAAGLAGRDGELATLRQKLEERVRHLEKALLEVAQRPAEAGLGTQLHELEADVRRSVADTTEKLATFEQQLTEALRARESDVVRVAALERDRRAPPSAVVEGVREALDALLEDAERERVSVAARFDAVASQRDELTAEISDVSTVVANRLEELVDRIDTVERRQAAGASESTRLSAEWSSKFEAITSLEAQLQSVAEGVAQAARQTESEQPALTELDERLRAVEQAGVDGAAEIARLAASWAAELDRIDAKIDDSSVGALEVAARDSQTDRLLSELGLRLDAIVHERQTVAAQIAKASENEVAELRTLIDGFRNRFTHGDPETGPPYVGGRLDELARRLDSIEDVDQDPAIEPGPGEGRLRLELRALELRAERAEKAAQQNRDAVLAQLDLLAGQIESRFRKLESDTASTSEGDGHAEVVPLRGAEA